MLIINITVFGALGRYDPVCVLVSELRATGLSVDPRRVIKDLEQLDGTQTASFLNFYNCTTMVGEYIVKNPPLRRNSLGEKLATIKAPARVVAHREISGIIENYIELIFNSLWLKSRGY